MKDIIKNSLFVFAVAFYTTLCFVLPDFTDSPVNSISTFFTLFSYVVALGIFQFLLIYIYCIEKHLFAVFLPLYFLLGAVVSYYRVAYKATITPMIIDVTLHTNQGTVAAVVSYSLILWVIFNLLLSLGIIYFRFKKLDLNYKLITFISVLTLFLLYYFANSRLHNSINQRYPMNVVCSVKEYIGIELQRNKKLTEIDYKIVNNTDSLNVIVVLGEALRADHLSLNGYQRNTCPRLQLRYNVVSLSDIYSEYTYTAASLPHILTPADSINKELAYSSHSFLYYLKNEEYNTTWISNQDLGKSYSRYILEADTAIFPNADKTVFVFQPWYDDDLLTELNLSLRNQKHAKNLYVIHTIGSHWYYNNHVPDSFYHFSPITENRIARNNSLEQLCNSYDNTVVYTDYILDSIISLFQSSPAVLFYISDHGEALGEDGNYLHANDAAAAHLPAALVWYSDKYAEMFPEKCNALRYNKDKHYNTDFLFYSVLSAAGIEVEGNNDNFDIFK